LVFGYLWFLEIIISKQVIYGYLWLLYTNRDWFLENEHFMEIMWESDEDYWRIIWENADDRGI